MRTVLFVCHANTCRSVMAHALLERMLRERGVDGAVRVRSAGVGNIARDGMLSSLDARLSNLRNQVGDVQAKQELAALKARKAAQQAGQQKTM